MLPDKTIFRVAKNPDNPFVMIDRRVLENPALSWKAKGILAYLLSRPDNWTVQVGDLIKRSQDGEHAVRAALDELIKSGHIVRRTERGEGGKFSRFVLEVHENPVAVPDPDPVGENQEMDDQPFCGFPQVENPHVGNRPINNTDLTNKESNNTDLKAAREFSRAPRRTDAKIQGDLLDGILSHTRPAETLDVGEFPEDTRQVIKTFCSLWGVLPPRPTIRKGEFALWIKEARYLADACGEFGDGLLSQVYEDWRNNPTRFTVGRPGSLIITARAKAGELRSGLTGGRTKFDAIAERNRQILADFMEG